MSLKATCGGILFDEESFEIDPQSKEIKVNLATVLSLCASLQQEINEFIASTNAKLELLTAKINTKEDAFEHNTAFNQNFSDDVNDYNSISKSSFAGVSNNVSRADHSHASSEFLKMTENSWGSEGAVNLCPDTSVWIMSNNAVPDVSGNYAFEATFTSVWEAFYCNFNNGLINSIKGKTVTFGVDYLEGKSARLELIVDGNVVNYILESSGAVSVEADIPSDVTSMSLRVVIYSNEELFCKFSGVYLHRKEDEEASEGDHAAFFGVKKVYEKDLASYTEANTLYITEKIHLYFAGDDGVPKPVSVE